MPTSLSLLHYDERADILTVHQLDRFENSCARGDRKNFRTLLTKDPVNRAADFHMRVCGPQTTEASIKQLCLTRQCFLAS